MTCLVKDIATFKSFTQPSIKECLISFSDVLEARLINLGGILTSLKLKLPTKQDKKIDVVLGYSDYKEYFNNPHYLGCLIGRVANRIKNGKIVVDGKNVKLDQNAGNHHIHGGKYGISKALWDMKVIKDSSTKAHIQLTYQDKHKSGSYPGSIKFKIVFKFSTIKNNGAILKIDFTASPDQPTPINLTYHPYFNLSGHSFGNLKKHSFKILSNKVAQNDAEQLPTGKSLNVKNTSLDLTKQNDFSAIDTKNDDFKNLLGFDHHYFFGKNFENKKMAVVKESKNRLMLEVFSTLPGLQFYTANNLDIKKGKQNTTYQQQGAFCLEPQYAPASIFKQGPDYPSIIFTPDKIYHHQISYRLSFF